MWQIIIIISTTVAGLTRLRAEAAQPVYFNFRDLKALTDMFVDCDTFVVSYGGLLHNVNDVSQPVMVYNQRHEYEKLGIKSMTRPYGFDQVDYYRGKPLLFRKTQTGRNCKAQILVFYQSLHLDGARSLNDLSGFRYDESVYRYTVIIHQDGYEIKRRMFTWPNAFAYVTVPHFYHVRMACNDEPESDNSLAAADIPLAIAGHFMSWRTCHVKGLKTACLYCKIDDILENEWKLDDRKICQLEKGLEKVRDGSIAINECHLNSAHYNGHVAIFGLPLEMAMLEKTNNFARLRLLNFVDLLRIMKKRFGPHAVFTKLDEYILPEEIFMDSILTHHPNVTLREVYMGPANESLIGQEVILGLGFPGPFWISDTVPVGISGISFMTCSNISTVSRGGIFTAPFDCYSWIWTLTSMILMSMALLMALKKRTVVGSFFILLYTMVRLLLDNYTGVGKKIVRRGKVMAALTFLMALVSIILSNGYKGVLTSDFAMPTVPICTLTLEQLLASNWSVNLFKGSTMLSKQKVPEMERKYMYLNVGLLARLWTVFSELISDMYDVRYSGENLKEFDLALNTTNTLGKFHNLWITRVSEGFAGECNCNGSYWFFERGTFWQPEIPKECGNVSISQRFFLSEEHVAKRVISWSTLSMRPGPVFTSIRRGIEAGLYHWLNKIRREVSLRGVHVKDNFMMRVQKKVPKPLTRNTALVSSTFWLCRVLSLISIAVLVGECLWKAKKRIYFLVRGWISKINCNCSSDETD